MRKMTTSLFGAGAALIAVSAASPAAAQHYGRDYYDRYDDRGIDLGDIAAGVAIIGGAALAIDALTSNNRHDRRYDRRYDPRYGYGHERAAVNACASVAQRYGRLERITDIDRRRDGSLRVRGHILVRDYDHRRWGRGYEWDRDGFSCYVRGNRVYDFNV